MPIGVLVLPSFYPAAHAPRLGIFVEDQARMLGKGGLDVVVASVESRSLGLFRPGALCESHFQTVAIDRGTHAELRRRAWNPMAQTRVGAAIWMWMAGGLLMRAARRFRGPVVVHAHNAILAGAAAVRLRGRHRLPVVITEHGSNVLGQKLPSWQRALCREAYGGADAVVAVSGALAASIAEISPESRPVRVIPNVVDIAHFNGPERTRDGAEFVFVSIGNLVPLKRVDLQIRAFAALVGRGHRVRLLVGGGGTEERALRELAHESGVGSVVEFVGPLDRDGVKATLGRGDCLVVGSDLETFSIIAAEAMSMGLPVIATDCGGPSDFVTRDTGEIVPKGDAGALSGAMERMISKRGAYASARIRDHIAALCSPEAVVAGLNAVYRNVLGLPSPSSSDRNPVPDLQTP